MSRRRSAKKRGKQTNSVPLIIGISVIVLLIVCYALFGNTKSTVQHELPIDLLSTRASQLDHCHYIAEGIVIDRFPRGNSEVVSFLYKDKSGGEHIIPICISEEVRKGLNINRNQIYQIEFLVEDKAPKVKGICSALSIFPK